MRRVDVHGAGRHCGRRLPAGAWALPGIHGRARGASPRSLARSWAGWFTDHISPGRSCSGSTCRSGWPRCGCATGRSSCCRCATCAAQIDYIGAALLTGGVTAFLLVLSWGGSEYPVGVRADHRARGRPPIALLFGTLVWHERRAPDPILPPRMFKEMVFTRGVALGVPQRCRPARHDVPAAAVLSVDPRRGRGDVRLPRDTIPAA